jgi:hypothetical protein
MPSKPASAWIRFLLTRAGAGAGLGFAAAALLVASPATGLLQLIGSADAVYAGPGMIGLAFASLSATAFLATALALGSVEGGVSGGRPVAVRAVVRQPPRRT